MIQRQHIHIVVLLLPFLVELEFGNQTLVFEEKGKPGYSKKNILHQRREPTTNSTHTYTCMVSMSGIELTLHQWEVNALTTETSLASQQISAVVRHFLLKFDLILYLSYQSMSQVITYRRKGDHKSITLIMPWTGFAIF